MSGPLGSRHFLWYNKGNMPELPEVETIRRGLKDLILNKKIIQVEILELKSFNGEKDVILSTKIVQIRRKGKALLIDLDNGYSLMIHLRMTGQIIYRASNGEIDKDAFAGGHPNQDFLINMPSKHTRVIFWLEGGGLFFNDQRKFGFVKVLKTEEIEKEDFIKKLGKEPWSLNFDEFKKILKKHEKANIKAVILDQHNVAGVGNIYADEALFYAKVNPDRLAGSLNDTEIKELIEGMRSVMEKSIESGGSTMATYVKADGSLGNYLDNFAQVFQRQGQKCFRCGAIIEKKRTAGRGTHFCPRCQK